MTRLEPNQRYPYRQSIVFESSDRNKLDKMIQKSIKLHQDHGHSLSDNIILIPDNQYINNQDY